MEKIRMETYYKDTETGKTYQLKEQDCCEGCIFNKNDRCTINETTLQAHCRSNLIYKEVKHEAN